MKKSCYNCAHCRSTLGKNPRIYCVLKIRSFSKRIPCKSHQFVFADFFSIPKK